MAKNHQKSQFKAALDHFENWNSAGEKPYVCTDLGEIEKTNGRGSLGPKIDLLWVKIGSGDHFMAKNDQKRRYKATLDHFEIFRFLSRCDPIPALSQIFY